MLLRQLDRRGVDVRPLLQRVGVPETRLRSSGQWIDWELWATLLDYVAECLGGGHELEGMAASLGDDVALHRFEWVAQMLSSPTRLYELNSRWGVSSQFRHMTSSCRQLPDGKLEITTQMPERYRGSKAAFHLALGVVRHLPLVIGLPAAQIVEHEVGSHFMRAVLVPPASRTLLQRARRGLTAFHGLESIFEQLSLQERELFEKNERLTQQLEEQKRVEARLRDSEERWRALAQNAPGHILLLAPDGTIRSASTAFEGIEPAQLIGRHLTDWALPDDQARLSAQLELVRTNAENCDLEWACGDNGARWYSCRVGPLVTDGQVVAMTAFLTDVTSRVQTQRALKQREFELQQAQKLESLGRLAGSIAHDFNNLLTVVISSVDLLREKPDLPQDSQLELDEIRHAGERAAELTRQLLAFTRQQVLSLEVLDPSLVVNNVARLLRRLLGEDITLDLALEPELAVRMDRGQLEQVLVNLAVNARDAMPRGGTLRIAISGEDFEPTGPRGLAAGRYVKLSVSDTGEGMDAATLDRIFEPFFSTKARGLGTGLGLAIVRGIVTASGGEIDVSSQPLAGTRFRVYLPRSEEEPTPVRKTAPVRPLGGTETILLVEDDEQVRRLTREILLAYGYRVLEAPKPADAFALAGQCPVQLLLTDVVLPEITGPQLARALSERDPQLRVLFISGYAQDEIVHRGIVQPGVDLLTKPFEPTVLAARVRQALDRSNLKAVDESA